MSDSSDDSSDDGLLDSPVFNNKKKPRSETRAEKSKLNFMNECLKGSDARTDVHKRIEAMDIEFGLKTEKSVEEDDDAGANDDGEKKVDGTEDKAGGLTAMEGMEQQGAEKNDNDTSHVVTKSDSKDTAATTTTTAATSTTTTTTKAKAPEKDEDWWARINSFEEINAQKTPRDVHLARRQLTDAVSGLDDYASDVTDDEGGKWKDGMSGMTREQLRSEAEAKSSGAYSNLGLRRMFRVVNPSSAAVNDINDTNKNKKAEGEANITFDTRQGAMTELKTIISSLQKVYRTPQTVKSDKVLRKLFIDPLIKILKKPQYIVWDMLNDFLGRNPIILGRYAVVLPQEFCKWMWKLACSSYDVGGMCSTTCCQLIRKFIVKKMDIEEVGNDNDNETPTLSKFCVDLTFLKNFCMDDLVSCLVNDFGLWLEPGPIKSGRTEKMVDDDNEDPMDTSHEDDEEEDEEDTNAGSAVVVDVYALKNVFLIWMALFERNLIRVEGVDKKEEDSSKAAFVGEDAARLVAAIARVGLDPSFNMASENYDTCAEPLFSLIQKMTASVVKSTAYQLSDKLCGDQARVDQWMDHTADVMVKACSDLLAGEEGASDSDDMNGHLVLAMAVKRMSCCELDDKFSIEMALMKLRFAVKALYKCLKEMSDWEEKVKERSDYLCKNWNKDVASADPANRYLQYAMNALVTSEVGLQWIDEESDSFMASKNHPHFLAAAIITGECASVGTAIYWRAQNDQSLEEEEPVFTTEEKDAVYEVVSNIEHLCNGLKKECRSVIAFPHLRRAKEYLTRFSKSLAQTKGKTSKDKRQRKREQGSLDSYFSRPSLEPQSDPFADTQESP